MKAMFIRAYGGPDVFEAGEVETPQPGKRDVLVRCRASSVNPVDASIRAGKLKSFVWLKLPAVLGVDVAGEVVETGRDATRFKRGERVFAFTGIRNGGGYGEYAVVPEAALAIIPSKLSWAEAGSVPGVGATAFEAFTERAPLEPGMRVFINGGAGGVGTWAVQIAKALGAEVSVTCSASKAALMTELGADRVIDYTQGDPFAGDDRPYDVVFNTVRGAPLERLRALLRRGGSLVTITGDHPGQILTAKLRNLFSATRTVVFFVRSDGALLEGLGRLIEAGRVRPVIEKTYGWHELTDAHRRIESGRVVGKLAVLAPA
jgi:NADPH:quinone reductase-like Zn-dependent oxidoreductase